MIERYLTNYPVFSTWERMTNFNRPRLLYVEDNEDTRLLISHLLSDSYEVRTSATIDEALAAVETLEFDLVIIDINLGEHRTGVDVLQHVRATRGDEVPVLALTAYALPGDREQYLAVGFDAYLSKPFSSEQLRKYISDLLGA